MRIGILLVVLVGVGVFAVVQDRVTAEAARRYAALHRAAMASGARGPSIDDVMRPAVTRSVRLGLVAGVGAVGGGLVLVAWATRSRSRE